MPVVTVKSAQVEEKLIPSSGKIMRSQTVGLELGNGFSLPFRVGLGQRPAYQPGEYDIDPKSFGLSAYGDLTLGKYVDLVPVGAAKPAAAKP
ncbi:single-stranded DNA-binding protein [Lysobacter niabensis]|uniref:single-stranded DNA-binding protein n=1 Tax=Agrilutibacter niabensis TaxID=380628 RepID=UPI003614DBA0